MKEVLVVSDNPLLVDFFMKLCVEMGVNKIANVKYQYSAINKNPSEMISLGATPIDLKNLRSVYNAKNEYDLIISLHCKQIFPSDLVSSVTCINVHPGFNPYNRGWYPQIFSILNKKQAGATIHLMDEEVDHGEIIDQIKVEVKSNDTSLDVYERVFEAEKVLIRDNLLCMIRGEYTSTAPSEEGNYNSIKDFKSLCELNLTDVASLGEHIDLLRALSHGEFKNAYFFDEAGRKIFIRVVLDVED